MESQYARKLRSGREYDPLFPRPSGKDREVKREASVGDTVHFIKDKAPENVWQTKAVARLLKGRNLQDTCRNVWNFVYQHIEYQKDEEGIEQVRSPRRVWWERKGDCDCYTSFISSVLLAMEPPIAHKYRITKYDKEDPSEIRWQHIYPVVPKSGRLDKKLKRRGDYIVLDCVKDAFDAEQPYYEKQDFDCKMKLNYLDGLEEEGIHGAESEYAIPPNVDARDLAALYDEEALGKAGWVKKAVSNVRKGIGKGMRFINRVGNPATILLRNGLLLAMKINFFKVAGKLRYAYLSDAQAKANGMNMDAFHKLKKVLEKAEKIYQGAGGKKDKLKAAILKGKGNHDHKVPLSGLAGIDDVYADREEYNIIHTDSVDGLGALGDPGTGALLVAATAAITAIGTALKSVKGLFSKGSKDAKEFNADGTSSGSKLDTTVDSASSTVAVSASTENPTEQRSASADASTEALVPVVLSASRSGTEETSVITKPKLLTTGTIETTPVQQEKKSLMKDPIGWVKENPAKAALGVLGVMGIAYVGYTALTGSRKSRGGLSGLEPTRRKKKGKTKKSAYRKSKLKAIKIL